MIRLIPLFVFALSIQYLPAQNLLNERSENQLNGHFHTVQEETQRLLSGLYDSYIRAEKLAIKEVINGGAEVTRNLAFSGKVIYSSPAVDYLNEIKHQLLIPYPKLDSLIHIYITDDVNLNAFATTDNNVYVNVGLLAALENEDQVAFILSHEIMHVLHQHVLNQFEKVNEKVSTITEDDVLNEIKIIQLYRHSLSRDYENEADNWGFKLFEEAGYNTNSAVRSLEILAEKNQFKSEISLSEFNRFFFNDTTVQSLIVDSLNNDMVIVNLNSDVVKDSAYWTHPSIESRIENMSSKILEYQSENVTQNETFNKIKEESINRLPSILAQNKDFIHLYIKSIKTYNSGERSSKVLNDLAYSLQGLLIDKLNKVKYSNEVSSSIEEKLLVDFYKNKDKVAFIKWVINAFSILEKDLTNNDLDDYIQCACANIVSNKKLDTLDIPLCANINIADDKKNELPKLKFSISPYADMTFLDAFDYFEHYGDGDYEDGNIVLVTSNNMHIRNFMAFGYDFAYSESKTDKLVNNSNKAMLSLSKSNEKIINVIPNSISYSGEEYETHKMLDKWLLENLYFEEYHYRAYSEEVISDFALRTNTRYLMSTVNIEIKSFSMRSGLIAYFSPIGFPFYFPMLLSNAIIDGTRNYQINVVFDIVDQKIAYWDKRTSNEPNTAYRLYQLTSDALKRFTNQKIH